MSTTKDTGEALPSSITCDSPTNNVKREEGEIIENKKYRVLVNASSPRSAAPKKKKRQIEGALKDTSGYRKPLRNNCSHQDSLIQNGRDGTGHIANIQHDTRMDMMIPLWLQGQGQAQRDLFL